MGPSESVVVEVLGQFRVRVGDRPVELPQGRRRSLLAVLAMSAGRTVSVDHLTDTVWGDALPDNAKRTIQTYVTRLRGALGTEAITTEPAGYALRTGPDNVDALRFLRLVEWASREPDVERELLIEALQLWRGDAFEDLESDRLRETEGRRLAEQRLTAIERRIDLDLADGRAREVIAELRDLTTRHPLREPLWVRLIVALARVGRQAEALEQYEGIRARIADELGVDPGAELQRVVTELPDGASTDVGVEAAASESAPSVPRQLPAAITGFVGRASALADLDQTLADAAGVVAVHGSGGVGKTALAVQWAHGVADRFPDGQLYLNLRGYGPGNPVRPATAMDALLRGLGVPAKQIPTDPDARESLLRSMLAGRRTLVLLDNVRSAEQVRRLLPGSSEPMVLVTSRSQLRGLVAREGARRIGLDQLSPEESISLLASALSAGQVPHEPVTLRELADRCGHLPLALSIAAERANRDPALGLDELIDELRTERERLDALDAGDESIDLRAVFTWSYQALDTETARMFRLLGLYPGPDIGVPAAAALGGIASTNARRLLDHLVDGNLVQQRRRGRFELHDLIREYAAELAAQLDGSDRQAALDRLFEWFVHSAAAGRRFLTNLPSLIDIGQPGRAVSPARFDDRQQAMTWYDAESRSLLAAVRLAADLGSHEATHRLLLPGWWFYLMRRRLFDEMGQALSLAEAAAERTGDANAQGQVANSLGVLHGELLDGARAAIYFRRAIELFERAGNALGEERALENLGTVLTDLEQTEEAATQLERAIEVGRRLGDERLAVNQMHKLATAYIAMARYDEAADLCVRAIEICRRRGDRGVGNAMSMMTLGEARTAQRRTTEAIELFRSAIEIFRAEDDGWYEGATLTNLGRTLRDAGQFAAARDVWQQALELFDKLGAPDGRYFSRSELAALLACVEPPPEP